jgi:chitodextrinase
VDDFPTTVATVARFQLLPDQPDDQPGHQLQRIRIERHNGTYVWDFGDGTTGSGVSTTHRYTRGGTFTIVMTVTSDNRQTSTSSRTITRLHDAAADGCELYVLADQSGASTRTWCSTRAAHQCLAVRASHSRRRVGAGAGRDVQRGTLATARPARCHRHTPLHAWRHVRDHPQGDERHGLTATTSRQLTISTTLPAGRELRVLSDGSAADDVVVFFNASSSTLSNGTYSWDFGDGNSGSGVTTTHTYALARTFTVTLTVRNQLGQSATISKTVSVTVPSDDTLA